MKKPFFRFRRTCYVTHFKDPNGTNATNVIFKSYNPSEPSSIVMNSMTIIDDSTIVVNITTGKVSAQKVYVSNNIDGELNSAFKVYSNCLGFYTTSYDASTNVFKTSLTATFVWDFGDVHMKYFQLLLEKAY